MVTVIQEGATILRKKAKAVSLKEIWSPKIQKVLKDMRAGIATRDDAVAIAAPQVGYSLRIFMVSRKIFTTENKNTVVNDAVFINPVIIKKSRKKVESDEGCLSIDTWYGKTKRAEKVTIRAYNEKGERVERGASGLLAQIFQHEIDHLNGILFKDHATNLVRLPPEETQKPSKKEE